MSKEFNAWFTVDELNAWAEKKLKENPHWAEQPAQQEPVAWMFQHEETGRMMCVDAQQVELGFEKFNPRLKKIAPLYTSPPAQRTWVGLLWGNLPEDGQNHDFLRGAVWAEAKLKELNT